jgi:hypothetical protein
MPLAICGRGISKIVNVFQFMNFVDFGSHLFWRPQVEIQEELEIVCWNYFALKAKGQTNCYR